MLIPPGGGVHKGAPVSRTGAASIDDSDDSDDSDNDDSSCRMEEESASKKPRSVSYNVGRVCKSRSEVCHELHHFFYHLASSVEVALATLPTDRDGHAGRPPQDVDPGDLVNMLDDQGTIDTYFEDFKALISRAKSGYAS
ncbi:hypothetical protein GQ54DRAFT_255042 [Martensiomyces pterosporus]|nr:hypothetical protein GQ54DRAFT_255042 [Martensiomyces pterosporus]